MNKLTHISTYLKKSDLTNHHELREDVSLDCSSPVLTDQSHGALADINVIMAQYAKTGMLPNMTTQAPRYIDNTEIPNLQDAFTIVRKASDMFYELPANIRRLMDNDPSQLENFIANSENETLLIKHGLLKKRAPEEKTPTELIPQVAQKIAE